MTLLTCVIESFEWTSATDGELFQAGSISKGVTALAALVLVGDGVLDLDRDVNDDLRSWRVPDDGVTIRRLLSHTSGMVGRVLPRLRARGSHPDDGRCARRTAAGRERARAGGSRGGRELSLLRRRLRRPAGVARGRDEHVFRKPRRAPRPGASRDARQHVCSAAARVPACSSGARRLARVPRGRRRRPLDDAYRSRPLRDRAAIRACRAARARAARRGNTHDRTARARSANG